MDGNVQVLEVRSTKTASSAIGAAPYATKVEALDGIPPDKVGTTLHTSCCPSPVAALSPNAFIAAFNFKVLKDDVLKELFFRGIILRLKAYTLASINKDGFHTVSSYHCGRSPIAAAW